MVFYKCRHGADLYCVGIICRVLKESIVGVEELLRQKEEELSGRTTVVQAAKEVEDQETHYVPGSGGPVSIQILVCSFGVGIWAEHQLLCSLEWIPPI